jgi:hypothetical protein
MARGKHAGGALAQEQDIGRDFRSRIGLEGGVRQPYRAQQVGMVGQVPADRVVFLVHRVAARNQRHDASGADLFQGLGEEVIVDRARELVGHGYVAHPVVAEWDIPHGQVEVIVRQRCILEALMEYRGVRVELPGDARGDRVKLDAGAVAAVHGLGLEAEEMAHAHGGLQHLFALAGTHVVQAVPYGFNHHRRREMRVRRRGAGRFVLLVRQQLLHRPGRASPFLGRGVAEHVGHRSPAHITREDGFLVIRGVAVFGFEGFEQADGGDIIVGFLAQPALAYPVGCRDPEVAGGLGLGFDVEDDSSGSRNWSIASSHAR